MPSRFSLKRSLEDVGLGGGRPASIFATCSQRASKFIAFSANVTSLAVEVLQPFEGILDVPLKLTTLP